MSTVLDSAKSYREEVRATEVEPGSPQELPHLRVLQIGKFYPPHFGGIETHLLALCNELIKFVDVEVIVASDSRDTIVENVGGVRVTRAGTAFNFAAAPVCPGMIRKIRENEADIVHIHLPNPTAILAYLASAHKGRLIISYHSDVIRQRLLDKAFWPFLRHALNKADVIIACSPNYIESSAILRRFSGKCRLITYAIPFDEFQERDIAAVEEIRKRYGQRIVVGVGRLVYYKGFEYLISAMKDVPGHLLLIGDGPLRVELERKAMELGLSDRVTILTNVQDVRPYYHSADVFVLSSIARSEAFGIVQLEAMACGVPVVNTALDSGVTFVSKHGVTGLTVPPKNESELAKAINLLLDDPALRARMGAAGRLRVEKEFGLQLMTLRTLELYREIVGVH